MKFFAGLNVWALPLAAVASFLFGGIWYGILCKRWQAAANIDPEAVTGRGSTERSFAIALLAELFMAWMLAGLLLHMTRAGLPATIRNGVITALFMWGGFVMTTMIVNHSFQGQKGALTLIDGGHWLGVLVIQGAILGALAIA
jgi:hypothetical protein